MKPTRFRMALLALIIIALFAAMGVKLGSMQLVAHDEYTALAEARSTKTYYLYGNRGTIYDANMIPLAYDRGCYNVTFYRDPTQSSAKARAQYTQSIIRAIEIIEKNGKEVNLEFWLERDENGDWQFNTGATTEAANKTRISQWRSNFFLTKTPVEDLFKRLCENYAVPDSLTEEQKIRVLSVWQLQRMNNYTGSPVIIAEDVGYECVCQIEAESTDLMGIEIAEGSTRVYPQKTLAAHDIGYVSKITTAGTMEMYQERGYPRNALVGSSGIEASLEDQLSQYVSYRQGKRVVEINRNGKTIRELSYEAPVDGSSVILTLDSRVQSVAEEWLQKTIEEIHAEQEVLIETEGWREKYAEVLTQYEESEREIKLAETGALVAMEVNTGRVIALASAPGFDLSMFEGELDREYWNQLVTDDRNPMYNRAIYSRDAPGSTFKMVTALGALMEGALTLDERISDGGYYNNGIDTSRKGWRCWIDLKQTWKHSNQTIVEALEHSCNYFFYTISHRMGIDALNKWAAQLGLTSKTGIELNNETTPYVGSQKKLYDADRSPYDQYTDKPRLAYEGILASFRKIAADRGTVYDEDKMEKAALEIMALADSDLPKDNWTSKIYEILQADLNIDRTYIARHLLGNEFYYLINELRWTPAETIMAGIGQSITQVTPISMARYVAAIANGGTVYNAQIVDKIVSATGEIVLEKKPVVANIIEGGEVYFDAIRRGMEDVSSGEEGTATQYFAGAKYMPAAKTGTSQRTLLDVENNAWIVVYAPIENPQIAVAVYIQNGYAGSRAAKAAWHVTDAYLDFMKERQSTNAPSENTLAD
ncbi:MAG: hypothetical protein IKO07_07300 [Clostridia bacterium]|nr:hypothetical protein [Clostridia bacterium]